MGSFPFVPPSLVGAYYLQPQDARAIFLHDDLLCNDTCSVTGGSITYWGGTNGKDPKFETTIGCEDCTELHSRKFRTAQNTIDQMEGDMELIQPDLTCDQK